MNCDSTSGLQLRGAGVFYINNNRKRGEAELAEIGEVRCNTHVEPDVIQIDGHAFAISQKHGVPDDVTERFWDIFNTQPDIKFENIPEDLKAFHNESLVAPLTADELRRASTRTLIARDPEDLAMIAKRQGLPGQCPAS